MILDKNIAKIVKFHDFGGHLENIQIMSLRRHFSTLFYFRLSIANYPL